MAGDPAGDSISVLLADAHTSSRLGLYELLTGTGLNVVAEAAHADELEPLLQAHRPQVSLLANNVLPEAPVPFLANLRHRYPDTQMVLLSAETDTLPVREMVQAGVVGVVLKREPVDAIVHIVQGAAIRNITFSQAVWQKWMSNGFTFYAPETNAQLTLRDIYILQLVCAGKGNEEIASSLSLSEKAIQKQLGALYIRLGVKNRVGAAVWFTRGGGSQFPT